MSQSKNSHSNNKKSHSTSYQGHHAHPNYDRDYYSGKKTSGTSHKSSSAKSYRNSSARKKQNRRRSQKRRRHSIRKTLISYSPLIGLCAAIVVGIVLLVVLVGPYISGRPKIEMAGESTVETAQGEPYLDEGATARIHRKDLTDEIYVTGDVDTSEIGTYDYTYNVDGRRRTFSKTRKVKVTDQTAPEITLNGDNPFYVKGGMDDYEEPGATAIDNCDGDISADISIKSEDENEYTWLVNYSVSDQAGNETTAVREVMLYDENSPEIVLNGDETITIDQNTEFEDPGVTATDDRDGDITADVVTSGYVDTYRSGTYTITYTVTDSFGNETSASRTVEVESAPVAEDHTIYLTFDDGPSTAITPQILDTLDAYDIKATFFIIDYTDDELPIIERIIESGHTIGIHGYSHEYSDIYTSVEAGMNNITKLAEKLKEDTGYEAFVVRFPGGSSNTVSANYCTGVMSELVEAVTDSGWIYMDWNVSTGDAENGSTIEDIINNYESELSESQENVVLMHDEVGHQDTADALQTLIDYGMENGYTFYPITQETTPIHHPVNN